MKRAVVKTLPVYLDQKPTTQDDNHYGIVSRWDVYAVDALGSKDMKLVGRLVEYDRNYSSYMEEQYCLFILGTRVPINPEWIDWY